MSAPARIRVKFLSRIRLPDHNIGADYLRRFPGRRPVLGSCEFIFDPDERHYDWLVVYDDLPRQSPEEPLACPAENTLLLTGEPSSITAYGQTFLRQFQHTLTSQEPWALHHPGVLRRQAGLLWYYGGTRERGSHDRLITAAPPEKKRSLSTVCSQKAMQHTLHALRLDFTLRLKEHLPLLDVFGYGMGKLDDKADALDSYRYHLAIENHSCDHHWTEKLSDAFLGYCLPLYYGCTNLDSYFPPESYVWIDIRQPEKAFAEIERIVRSPEEYERRLPFIREARRRVLEDYATFPQLARIIEAHDRGLRGADTHPRIVRRRYAARMHHPILAIRDLLGKVIQKNRINRLNRPLALLSAPVQPTRPATKPSSRAVAVIEWNTTGHHPTYLREYILALLAGGRPVVVLSTQAPDIEPLPGKVAWRAIPTMQWIKARKLFTTRIARRLYARHIRGLMREAEQELGVSCDRVLLGCLHEAQSFVCSRVLRAIGLSAAGLYVQAGIFYRQSLDARDRRVRKVHTIMHTPELETIFMLDAGAVDAVRKFSGKQVVLLPDVTDTRLAENDPLIDQLDLRSKPRPLLGLLGHLRPSKGIVDLLRFAQANPQMEITILLAGEIRWSEFTREDEAVIRDAVARDSRIIFHPHRIPSETTYNALLVACDVIWAVYRDCPHSSNTLVKAAAFARPVIVAEGFLMAQETREFSLGEVVPPQDYQAMADAIHRLQADTGWRSRSEEPRLAYGRSHSNEDFQQKLNNWARSLC